MRELVCESRYEGDQWYVKIPYDALTGDPIQFRGLWYVVQRGDEGRIIRWPEDFSR